MRAWIADDVWMVRLPSVEPSAAFQRRSDEISRTDQGISSMGVLAARHESNVPFIRSFVLSRDLPALADLVEVSFETELSQTSSQIVAEMRDMANWGLTLRLLTLLGPPYRGLVWAEAGRLVGNVSMSRERPGVWSLSNVAVLPDARRRGIAGALVDAAVAQLDALGARHVTLQVRPDNAVAVGMYAKRGFVTYDRVCELALDPDRLQVSGDRSSSEVPIRRLHREDLPRAIALLHDSVPPLARQIDPVRDADWEQGTWHALVRGLGLALRGQERIVLVAPCDHSLAGIAWATVRVLGTFHEIGIATPTGFQTGTSLARSLLGALLMQLADRPVRPLRATVSCSQPGIRRALEDAGFEMQRELDRMVLTLG